MWFHRRNSLSNATTEGAMSGMYAMGIKGTIRSISSNMKVTSYSRRFISKNLNDEPLRNAQASEAFRSAYFDSIRASNRISSEDIDDMVAAYRVRPSLLLPIYHITGFALGTAARFSPKACSDIVTKAVDNATVQQFNDSIRDSQLNSPVVEDAKETLKYHRDLETDASTLGHSTDNDRSANPTELPDINAVGVSVSTALYQFLKLSRGL